jgi:hypothetical protein
LERELLGRTFLLTSNLLLQSKSSAAAASFSLYFLQPLLKALLLSLLFEEFGLDL